MWRVMRVVRDGAGSAGIALLPLHGSHSYRRLAGASAERRDVLDREEAQRAEGHVREPVVKRLRRTVHVPRHGTLQFAVAARSSPPHHAVAHSGRTT